MARILLALTSNEKLGTTGRKTGFYAPEAARPFGVFTAAGHEVNFVSVRGGQPPVDGVKPDDTVVAKFLLAEEFRLTSTPRLPS